LNKEIKGS